MTLGEEPLEVTAENLRTIGIGQAGRMRRGLLLRHGSAAAIPAGKMTSPSRK